MPRKKPPGPPKLTVVPPESMQPEARPLRDARGRILPGQSGNPGGRPKALREIQDMLDREHRSVTNMTEVFARLKALALGTPVHIVDKDGGVTVELQADAAFMKLYLDRVLGPVKEQISDEDLRDAPQSVLDWLAQVG